MKFLLDTHVAIRWEANHPALSQATRNLILGATDDVLVSRCSLWEMAVKVNLGRLKIDLGRFLQRIELTDFGGWVLRATTFSRMPPCRSSAITKTRSTACWSRKA